MKNLLRFLAFVLMVGNAYAQSNLPACQGGDSARWSDCFGTTTFANGNRYVGEFKNGEYSGHGTFTTANGDKFVGEWVNGLINGLGTEFLANGDAYGGKWDRGMLRQGTVTFAQGGNYVGELRDGKPNGQGTLFASNGSIINQGVWANGIFVRPATVQQSITSIALPSNLDQDRRSPGIKLEDESIELRIAQSLRRNISGSGHINVTSYNRIVLLTGEVGSSAEKERADRLAKSQENVSAVVNELAIEPASSLTQRSKDIITTGQIKALMVNEKDLQANAFKVVVDRGIVYLMGRVTTREAQRASEIALSGRVSSVVKVVRVFEIISEQELSNVSSRINYVASPERSERNALDQQIAAEKERERITADLDAERRKRQELEAQLKLAEQPTKPNKPIVSFINERRVALVIGNATYKVNPLKNPVNDSTDMARSLRSVGFDVIEANNTTLAQMRDVTRRFADKLGNSDVGLVYYSGHGVEVKGKNYLIPVNADIKREYEVVDQAFDASQFLEMMDNIRGPNNKRVNILIVDACRNNELQKSWRSTNNGLARMDAPGGTFISFATAPGRVAADGTGRNSPYTKHLLQALKQPNVPIEQVFKVVRRNVMEETKGEQIPWENSSLVGDFYFTVLK